MAVGKHLIVATGTVLVIRRKVAKCRKKVLLKLVIFRNRELPHCVMDSTPHDVYS